MVVFLLSAILVCLILGNDALFMYFIAFAGAAFLVCFFALICLISPALAVILAGIAVWTIGKILLDSADSGYTEWEEKQKPYDRPKFESD